MGSRNFAQVAPTPATMALNAYIFGYGGHSLVTPHTTLKQLWWTDERIEKKVNRSYVVSKLRGEEREFLNRPLAFGEGLTDDTYLEWILEKAKRLFLILALLGVPDQIFGCIDDAWTDEDLPVAADNVHSLELSYDNDIALNMRFYDTQFLYLLRELKEGSHIDYGPKEHIPMEYVNTLPPAVGLQCYDRVHFPGNTEAVFMRRKYELMDRSTGQEYRDAFHRDITSAQNLTHRHIVSPWASYTSDTSGYIISTFIAEHTLATFIDHRTPTQFTKVAVSQRPVVLCQWIHCLADALASLHYKATAHTAIRPSNIWIDKDNNIAFADVGSLWTFQRGKKASKTEAYDYAAPESHICRSILATPARSVALSASPSANNLRSFAKIRKLSISTSSSSHGSSGGSSHRSTSVYTGTTSPVTSSENVVPMNNLLSLQPNEALASVCASNMSQKSASRSFLNFSRHLPRSAMAHGRPPMSPSSFQTSFGMTSPDVSSLANDASRGSQNGSPMTSDIYSLGCIYLDIITFILRGRLSEFVKIRTSKSSSYSDPDGDDEKTMNDQASTFTTRSARRRGKIVDSSFHGAPDKIQLWIDQLESECLKRASMPEKNSRHHRKSKGSTRLADTQAIPIPAYNATPNAHEIVRSMNETNTPNVLEDLSAEESPVEATRPPPCTVLPISRTLSFENVRKARVNISFPQRTAMSIRDDRDISSTNSLTRLIDQLSLEHVSALEAPALTFARHSRSHSEPVVVRPYTPDTVVVPIGTHSPREQLTNRSGNEALSSSATANLMMNVLPALLGLVRRMLSHDVSMRPSASELRDEIGDILGGQDGIVAQGLCCRKNQLDNVSKIVADGESSDDSAIRRTASAGVAATDEAAERNPKYEIAFGREVKMGTGWDDDPISNDPGWYNARRYRNRAPDKDGSRKVKRKERRVDHARSETPSFPLSRTDLMGSFSPTADSDATTDNSQLATHTRKGSALDYGLTCCGLETVAEHTPITPTVIEASPSTAQDGEVMHSRRASTPLHFSHVLSSSPSLSPVVRTSQTDSTQLTSPPFSSKRAVRRLSKRPSWFAGTLDDGMEVIFRDGSGDATSSAADGNESSPRSGQDVPRSMSGEVCAGKVGGKQGGGRDSVGSIGANARAGIRASFRKSLLRVC